MDVWPPNVLPASLANFAVSLATCVLISWVLAIVVARSAVFDLRVAAASGEVLRLAGAGKFVQSLHGLSRFHLQHLLRHSHAESSCTMRSVVNPQKVTLALRGNGAPPTTDNPAICVDAHAAAVPRAARIYWGVHESAVHALLYGGVEGLRSFRTEGGVSGAMRVLKRQAAASNGGSMATADDAPIESSLETVRVEGTSTTLDDLTSSLLSTADCLACEDVAIEGTPLNLTIPQHLRLETRRLFGENSEFDEASPSRGSDADAATAIDAAAAAVPWPRLVRAISGRYLAVVVAPCTADSTELIVKNAVSADTPPHVPGNVSTHPGAGMGLDSAANTSAGSPSPIAPRGVGGRRPLRAQFIVLLVEWALPEPLPAVPATTTASGSDDEGYASSDGAARSVSDVIAIADAPRHSYEDTVFRRDGAPVTFLREGGAAEGPPPSVGIDGNGTSLSSSRSGAAPQPHLPQPRLLATSLMVLPSRCYAIAEVFGMQSGTEEECSVCLTEPRCVLLLPCRHQSVCMSCFRHLSDKCPVCRAPFQDYVHAVLDDGGFASKTGDADVAGDDAASSAAANVVVEMPPRVGGNRSGTVATAKY